MSGRSLGYLEGPYPLQFIPISLGKSARRFFKLRMRLIVGSHYVHVSTGGMTMRPPMLDPKRDLAGATPET